MHQEHIVNTTARGGRRASATEKWHTCKNEQEMKKQLSGFYSMSLT
jgi:hypothetical protein